MTTKPIPGYENSYLISEDGTITSLLKLGRYAKHQNKQVNHFQRNDITSGNYDSMGYARTATDIHSASGTFLVGLRSRGRKQRHKLIDLLALTFIGPPVDSQGRQLVAVPINGDWQDVRLANIEYRLKLVTTIDQKLHQGAISHHTYQQTRSELQSSITNSPQFQAVKQHLFPNQPNLTPVELAQVLMALDKWLGPAQPP